MNSNILEKYRVSGIGRLTIKSRSRISMSMISILWGWKRKVILNLVGRKIRMKLGIKEGIWC